MVHAGAQPIAVTSNIPKAKPIWERAAIFWRLIGPYRFRSFGVLLIVLAAAGLESVSFALILPLLQFVFETDSPNFWSGHVRSLVSFFFSEENLVVGTCGLFLAILVAKNVFLVLQEGAISHFSQWLRRYWMYELHKSYMTSPIDKLLSKPQGTLINNITKEPDRAAKGVFTLLQLIASAVLSLAFFVVLLITDAQVTLILTALLAVVALANKWITGTYAESVGQKEVKLSQQATNVVSETIGGARQVRAYGLKDHFLKKYDEIVRKSVKVRVRFQMRAKIPHFTVEIMVGTALVAAMVYLGQGGTSSLQNAMPYLAAFVVIANRLGKSITAVLTMRMRFLSLLQGFRTVAYDPVLNRKREKQEEQENKWIGDFYGDIEFKDVCFRYDGKSRLIDRLNITIPKGKFTALMGPSGIGKSTLIDLILGLYEIESGQILVNSRNLKEIDRKLFLSRLGYLEQDPFLFNGSVASNIQLGRIEAPREEIERAARQSGAHEFVKKLPDAYDTLVVDRGLNLSGGQRQRIALARALIRSPDYLIFDEPTSALDQESSSGIIETIRSFTPDKSVIVISHAKEIAKAADVSYYLDQIPSFSQIETSRPEV